MRRPLFLLPLVTITVSLFFLWSDFSCSQVASGGPRALELQFDPERPVTGDQLKLRFKLDGGALRAEVNWMKDNEEIQKNDFDGVADGVELKKTIKKDDKLSVEVIPFDATGASGPKAVKKVSVGNAPPLLKLQNQHLEGNLYIAIIEATDPEGDQVELSLAQGPKGAVIDQAGQLTWKFDPNTSGSFPMKVSAKDSQGGQSALSFTVGLHWQKGK
jgi:hypothetical protein